MTDTKRDYTIKHHDKLIIKKFLNTWNHDCYDQQMSWLERPGVACFSLGDSSEIN